jgi:hypothetical protein
MDITPSTLNHEEILSQLRREAADLKARLEALQGQYDTTVEAVKIWEKLAAAPQPKAPGIIVGADQFRGLKTPDALKRLMLSVTGAYTSADLGDALMRGGFGNDVIQIRQNMKHPLKLWRKRTWVEFDDKALTWVLTPEGRRELGATNEPALGGDFEEFPQPDLGRGRGR